MDFLFDAFEPILNGYNVSIGLEFYILQADNVQSTEWGAQIMFKYSPTLQEYTGVGGRGGNGEKGLGSLALASSLKSDVWIQALPLLGSAALSELLDL